MSETAGEEARGSGGWGASSGGRNSVQPQRLGKKFGGKAFLMDLCGRLGIQTDLVGVEREDLEQRG